MVDAECLQKYSLFGGLLPSEIEVVRSFMGSSEYKEGELIIAEGEPNDRIHFVLEGKVGVDKNGRRLLEIGEGETFGEIELLDIMPAVASITALRKTTVATITNRGIHLLFKADSRIFSFIIMNLARDLSRRLRRMDELACRQG